MLEAVAAQRRADEAASLKREQDQTREEGARLTREPREAGAYTRPIFGST